MIFLKELAQDRQSIIGVISAQQPQLIRHLFKIVYHGRTNPGRAKHWAGDLSDILFFLPVFKGTNKPLKEKTIYEYLWGGIEDRYDIIREKTVSYLNKIRKDPREGGFPYIDKKRELALRGVCFQFCTEYMHWLAKGLSSGKGSVTEEEVKAKIAELIRKYPEQES